MAMTIWQAAVLGLIQGVTEFLPVSSSGHLVIVQSWLGVEEPSLTFDVMVHFGTLIAVLAALRSDWTPIVSGLLGDRTQGPEGRRRLFLLIVGSIPVGVAGLALKDRIEALFGSAAFAGWMLLLTGFILWFADRRAKRRGAARALEQVGVVDALLIGIGQACAILPGLSRSGVTIAAGLMRGLSREAAARFAFLLAIPAILGATVLEAPGVLRDVDGIGVILVGTLTAAIAGYWAITLFLRLLRHGSLLGFAVYTWVVGALVVLTSRG